MKKIKNTMLVLIKHRLRNSNNYKARMYGLSGTYSCQLNKIEASKAINNLLREGKCKRVKKRVINKLFNG